MKSFDSKMTIQLDLDFGFKVKPDATEEEIENAIDFFENDYYDVICEEMEEAMINSVPGLYSCKATLVSHEPFDLVEHGPVTTIEND